MYFDLTIPEGLKIKIRQKKKIKRRARKGRYVSGGEKKLALLLVFSCSGEKILKYLTGVRKRFFCHQVRD